MKDLYISVAGKTATYLKRGGSIVCDNDDYRIAFIFDNEWETVLAAGSVDLVVRFVWHGKYHDEPLKHEDDLFWAPVPAVDNTSELYVGLYVDGQLRTTTVALIPCEPSLHSIGAKPGQYTGKGYSEEAKVAATTAVAAAASAEAAAASAEAAKQTAVTANTEAQSAAVRAERAAETAVALDKTEEVDALRKRVILLERGVTPDPYYTDASVAYRKVTPSGALPYAMLTSVGGMTRKPANIFNAAFAVDADLDRGYQFSVDGTGFTLSNTSYETTYTTFRQFCPRAVVGKTYTITYYGSTNEDGTSEAYIQGMPSGTTFVLTEAMASSGLGIGVPMMEHGGHEGYVSNIMINEGSTTLPWEAYTETLALRDAKVTRVRSMKDYSTLRSVDIPAEVQALDGYGWGISANLCNSIDWDEEGKATFVKRVGRVTFNGTEAWGGGTTVNGFYVSSVLPGAIVIEGNVVAILCDKFAFGTPDVVGVPCAYSTAQRLAVFPGALATTAEEWRAKLAAWAAAGTPLTVYYPLANPVKTDISHLITKDNIFPVEVGGPIIFENARSEAVPSTVIYQLKPTE